MSENDLHVQKLTVAPPNSGETILGLTIPSLLDRAISTYPNPKAFNQPHNGGDWYSLSAEDFREEARQLAAGLVSLNLAPGEKVGLYLHSDLSFCLADMACQMAGLVDVPLYLAYSADLIEFVLNHAEAKTVFVGDPELLQTLVASLPKCPDITRVIYASQALVEGKEEDKPLGTSDMPEGVELITLDRLRESGKTLLKDQPAAVDERIEGLSPQDLATILYTSGTTGQPKGVMLSHENITSNSTAAISGMIGFEPGASQRALCFLPMTHIFARTLNYAFMGSGIGMYFVDPKRLADYFKPVAPTIFITVPHVIQKLLTKILEKRNQIGGLKAKLFDWSMRLGRQYEVGKDLGFWYNFQLGLARKIVFSKWRAGIGGEIKYIISGGAPLSGEYANLFAAADIKILQGYGLTESSPIISFNRPDRNRAGTVGVPMHGVEVALGPDDEIVTRGPHIMMGYFKNEEATAETISGEWLHTGDIGAIDDDGYIRITDRKKAMFKLSTGKYVTPSPIEQSVSKSPLIDQAMVTGIDERFCGVLIFVDEPHLLEAARLAGVEPNRERLIDLLDEKAVQDAYREVLNEGNEGMPKWSCIKRAAIIYDQLSVEDGTLTPTLKLKRKPVAEKYGEIVEAIYGQSIFEAGGDNWRLLIVEELKPGSSMEF